MNNNDVILQNNLTYRRFRFFIFLLRLAGIPMFENVPKLFKIYDFITIISVLLLCVSTVMTIVVRRGDLEHTMDTVREGSAFALCIWMHCFLRIRRKDVMKLMSLTEAFIWETLPRTEHSTGAVTMAGWIYIIESFIRKMLIFIFVFHFSIIGARILLSHEKTLVFDAWFPYNATLTPGFEITMFLQVVASVSNTCTFFAFTGLYATLVCVACSQLENLKSELLQNKESLHIPNCEPIDGRDKEKGVFQICHNVICLIHKNVNKCIRYHQEILSFMQSMENVLNAVMTGIFLIGLIALCICSFSIITSWGNFSRMAQGFMVYVLTIIVLAICCWFGYELSSQALSIKDAAFECDWIGTPIPYQRKICFIIAMANKEFTLTAGKFVPVSIATLVNIVNQSVSYFMFLLEVKDRLENTKLTTDK